MHEGLLTTEEIEDCISITFNPVRAGFHGSDDVWTRDVLNLGVKPDKLIAKVGPRHSLLPNDVCSDSNGSIPLLRATCTPFRVRFLHWGFSPTCNRASGPAYLLSLGSVLLPLRVTMGLVRMAEKGELSVATSCVD